MRVLIFCGFFIFILSVIFHPEESRASLGQMLSVNLYIKYYRTSNVYARTYEDILGHVNK